MKTWHLKQLLSHIHAPFPPPSHFVCGSTSFSVLLSPSLLLPLCLSFPAFLSSSFSVPSVHCHIEFSQEFEHESLISNSCCSCARLHVCVYVSEFVRVWLVLTILPGSLSPQSQFHTPSSLLNSVHTLSHTKIVHTCSTCRLSHPNSHIYIYTYTLTQVHMTLRSINTDAQKTHFEYLSAFLALFLSVLFILSPCSHFLSLFVLICSAVSYELCIISLWREKS